MDTLNPHISKTCPQGSKAACPSGTVVSRLVAPHTDKYDDCATGWYEYEASDNFEVKSSGYYALADIVPSGSDNKYGISVKIYQDNWTDDNFISSNSLNNNQKFYLSSKEEYYFASPYGASQNFTVCIKQV